MMKNRVPRRILIDYGDGNPMESVPVSQFSMDRVKETMWGGIPKVDQDDPLEGMPATKVISDVFDTWKWATVSVLLTLLMASIGFQAAGWDGFFLWALISVCFCLVVQTLAFVWLERRERLYLSGHPQLWIKLSVLVPCLRTPAGFWGGLRGWWRAVATQDLDAIQEGAEAPLRQELYDFHPKLRRKFPDARIR